MKWTSESPERRYKRNTSWQRWFAWYPVRIGEHIVWLEAIERKGELHAWPGDCYWTWEFRESKADRDSKGKSNG